MYMALSMVTDRTQGDVDLLKSLSKKPFVEMTEEEQALWRNPSFKGAYNYTDLNRVEAAVKLLAEELTSLGFPVTVETKINWKTTDIPTEAHMARYLNNLAAVQNAAKAFFAEEEQLPQSMKRLSFEDANRIERMLVKVETWTRTFRSAITYCGTVFTGEGYA